MTEAAQAMGARKRCSEFDRLGDEERSKVAPEAMHTIQVFILAVFVAHVHICYHKCFVLPYVSVFRF